MIIKWEKANFNGTYLEWPDSVYHIVNYIDITCTDMIDCNANFYFIFIIEIKMF